MASGRKGPRMFLHPSLRVIEASDAAQRLSEARAWVAAARGRPRRPDRLGVARRGGRPRPCRRAQPAAAPSACIVSASPSSRARLAAPVLAARGIAPVSFIGGEAVAARATFEASRSGGLDYFGPVARTQDSPRARAHAPRADARESRRGRARSLPLGGADLARLLERFEDQFAAASATDRGSACSKRRRRPRGSLSRVSRCSCSMCRWTRPSSSISPRGLIAAAPDVLVTIPFGDLATLDRFEILGLEPSRSRTGWDVGFDRAQAVRLRDPPTTRTPRRSVTCGSSRRSGEGAGVRRDRPADSGRSALRVFRSTKWRFSHDRPRDYVGLLGHAFSRAGIPGWFDRGTGRPHPSGRAFLALLGCAVERLSAARFAEYPPLSQVPEVASPAAASAIPPPADDLFSGFTAIESPPDEPDPGAEAEASGPNVRPHSPKRRHVRSAPTRNAESPSVVDGTLRAP